MSLHLPLSLRTPWQSVSHDHQEEEEEKVCGDSLNFAFCTALNYIMAPAKLKLQQTLLANSARGARVQLPPRATEPRYEPETVWVARTHFFGVGMAIATPS